MWVIVTRLESTDPHNQHDWKNKMTIKRNREQLDAIKEVKDYGWLCGGDNNSNLNTVSGIYNITNIIKLDGILSNTSSTKNR
jgi:hypothetical protein